MSQLLQSGEMNSAVAVRLLSISRAGTHQYEQWIFTLTVKIRINSTMS